MDASQLEKIRSQPGFFAALDQSGGSTPKALGDYGISEDQWSSDAEMFDLVHAMRTRVITNPAFDGNRILAAILFEQTMDRQIEGVPTSHYLWDVKNVVPYLKVDKGLADEVDGVQLMKSWDTLDETLEKAIANRIFGTKMRSVISRRIRRASTRSPTSSSSSGPRSPAPAWFRSWSPRSASRHPDKAEAETLLHAALHDRLNALPGDAPLMFKLTIPTEPGLYADLAAHPRVLRVLALSGGYSTTRPAPGWPRTRC